MVSPPRFHAAHATAMANHDRMRLEAFYFAFGDDDVVGICELPDNETAAAFALETSASGRVSVLITPEEVDRAREKKSGWRAPGA